MSLFFGSKLANKNLPAVVVYFSNFLFPLSSTVSKRETIVVWTLICPVERACSIASALIKYPSGLSVWKGACDK